MAERELAILLTAKNLASRGIKNVTSDVTTLGKSTNRAGQGVKTLGSNIKTLGKVAAAGIVVGGIAAIKSGLDSLAERENVISATEAAIKATGGAARVSAKDVRTWSEQLERATGAAVDDKAIQAAATTLIRFGSTTRDSFERTLAAATDLGAGMKKGPEAGAKLLGKALANPVKGMAALRKAGIVLSAAEEKRIKKLVTQNKVQEAQGVILAAVEKRYKGAAAASAGPYTRALNLLADASEDAKMALAEGFLPILTKVADKLSTALADPKAIASIREVGQGLAGGFDKALQAAEKIPWDTIRSSMELAGKGAKAAYDLFNGLPPWVQTAVVTGWGLNKLTGGALTGIAGELGKGLIKGVLGMTAGVVNINAGVVNGAGGGVPGAAGGFTGGKPGGIGAVGKIATGGIILSGVALSAQTISEMAAQNAAAADRGLNPAEIQAQWYYNASVAEQQTIAKRLGYQPTKADFNSGTAKLTGAATKTNTALNRYQTTASVGLRAAAAASRAAGITAGLAATRAGGTIASASRNAGVTAAKGGHAAASAVRHKKMSFTARVNVTTRIDGREWLRQATQTNIRGGAS